MERLRITRHPATRLLPDPTRVIARPFVPRDEVHPDGSTRIGVVLARLLAMDDDAVTAILADVHARFDGRHRDLDGVLDRGLAAVEPQLDRLAPPEAESISAARRQVIGAYFTQEYAIEAAALGNPSIVLAPDQFGLDHGEARFVMSLRAIGEGHISSIEFRTGVIGQEGTVRLEATTPFVSTGDREPHDLEKSLFTAKLHDLGVVNDVAERVLTRLPARFSIGDLEAAVQALDGDGVDRSLSGETTRLLHWLATSNYRVSFRPSTPVAERVLVPSGPAESHGMEDARFVRFVDDGVVTYYATYTAFDGHQILPQLIETADFVEFRVTTMSGTAARNKGIAIFPRRIGGRVMALGRHDNVNNYLMASDDVRVWDEGAIVQQPERPWELMQLGNCGSPIETAEGWLVITHGVGAMRTYSLGALLLDLDDPSQVIGHLDEPLLSPTPDEREGYVPNVVYSCGGMIHGTHLVVPYGFADVGAALATVPVDDLLAALGR